MPPLPQGDDETRVRSQSRRHLTFYASHVPFYSGTYRSPAAGHEEQSVGVQDTVSSSNCFLSHGRSQMRLFLQRPLRRIQCSRPEGKGEERISSQPVASSLPTTAARPSLLRSEQALGGIHENLALTQRLETSDPQAP